MKKTGIFRFLFVLCTLCIAAGFTGEENSPVHWISFEEAVAKTKIEPRPIMIDIYTQWCGPCKMMSKHTFGDKNVASYLNKTFYCVKFDAECFDTVRLGTMRKDTVRENGKIVRIDDKPDVITFVNFAAPGTPKSPHQFAWSILDQKLQYPSIVFLSSSVQRLEVKAGYYPKEQFEPIVKYYGSGAWSSKKYEEFLKTYKPEF
ncbi:MAG: thioredoxin-related protein [Bacteroidetes bacterium]|jgi:thioredoxin-related protein|nr:thioredoxin-related protein [Bacteroidota bacterium]